MTPRLHYETLGAGAPVFILHGLLGSGRNWFSLARRLAEDYQVILPDARNHGKSGHSDDMSYAAMAEDLRALMDALSLRRAHVAGHSMGGKTAMAFALAHPTRVRSLLALDIAPARYRSDFAVLLSRLRQLDLRRVRSRQEADAALAKWIPQAVLRAFLLHNLRRAEDGDGSPCRWQWRPNLPGIEAALDELCDFPPPPARPAYTGPALFLSGADSRYVRPEHHAAIHEFFPQAELRAVDKAGHWLHADQPERVLEETRRFLLGA